MSYTKLSRITLNYPLTDKYMFWCFPEQNELKHEIKIMSENLPTQGATSGKSALKFCIPQYRQLPSACQLQSTSKHCWICKHQPVLNYLVFLSFAPAKIRGKSRRHYYGKWDAGQFSAPSFPAHWELQQDWEIPSAQQGHKVWPRAPEGFGQASRGWYVWCSVKQVQWLPLWLRGDECLS